MQLRSLRGITVALSVAMALGVAACGGDQEPYKAGDAPITGSVSEWKVTVANAKATAGEVTFRIENKGTIEHEFLVVKTDAELGKIPVTDGRFSEEDPILTMIDEIGEYAEGTTEDLTVTLEPGKYQLVCNIEGHYANGMYTAFEVVA